MSFNLNRTNNQITKKNISINSTINSNNLKDSIGSTGITTIANVNTLSLNGTPLPVTATQINTTQILSLGTAEPAKVLITNSSNNISNINSISCNTLIAGGQNITIDTFQSSSSDDSNNPYLLGLIDGVATSSKALTTNYSNSISNINTLSLSNINLNNILIKNSNKYNNSLIINNYENLYSNIYSINTGFTTNIATYAKIFTGVSDNAAYLNDFRWPSICWSPELSLFVAVSNGTSGTVNGTNRIAITKDTVNWKIISAFDQNWEDIIWISKLKLFVAVSSTGGSNQIMTSPDSINWTLRTTPSINYAFKSLTWSNELNLCVAVNTTNNGIIISNDCINWRLVYTNQTVGLNYITWAPELSLFVATGNAVYNGNYRIYVSNDGTNWNAINYLSTASFLSICWSPYWKMFIIPISSSPYLIYSYDGFNWQNGTTVNKILKSIIWIDELKLFYGHDDSGNIVYSKKGITDWTAYQIATSAQSLIGKLSWSPELGIIIASMRQGNTSLSSNNRFNIVAAPYIGKKPNLLATSNLLYQDKINKNYGFNTNQPNRPLEINSNNGNLLKILRNGISGSINTINMLSTGQLDISFFNLTLISNYSTYGLKLNNILLTNTPTVLNTLSNTSTGIAKSFYPLITDSSNNISNLNTVKCNSLIVNGTNYNLSNNNYFNNAIIGSASDSKALILDENSNINNINILSSNKLKINNNLITNKNTTNIIHNLTNYNNKINKPNLELFNRYFNNFTTITLTGNGAYTGVIWVSELQLFIGIMSTSATNTNRIITSTNGINWIENTTPSLASLSFKSIVWSPELQLLVATNNTTGFTRIYTSTNGFDWYQQTDSNTQFNLVSICWSPELNLFAAVSSDSTTGKIIISSTGYNWSIVESTSFTFIKVIWANKLNLFIAITSLNTDPLYISTDGCNWINTNITISNVTSNFTSICWSEELNMIIAISASTSAYYSYNGYIWYQLLLSFNGTTVKNIEWISELNLFICSPDAGSAIAYSNDGFIWYRNTTTFASRIDTFAWSSDLKKLVMLPFNSATAYIINTVFPTNSLNTVVSQSNNLIINKTNGNFGIGLNPSYQLELSTDSAAKATSSSWTIGSDIRLKEDIELADLDICYNNFKNINLVRYKWKNDIYDDNSINDRTQLGWIAQDIETIFPKSVTTVNKFNLEDCKLLNSDQLLSTLYGTVQKLINNYENQNENINNIDLELTNIDNFLKNLEIAS